MSISQLLIQNGAKFVDLGFLSIISYPYAVKFLVAPILDSFYWKKFGRRKSYIVPLQYLYSILCFVLAWELEDYIKDLKISQIFYWGLMSMIIIVIQDVAVDGWVTKLLTKDYYSYGSAAQTMDILGSVLSYNLFIPLNSVSFCNEYLFSEKKETPLLSVSNFWLLNGVLTITVTFFIHIWVKEKETKDESQVTFGNVVGVMKLFYKNPNLRKLSAICLTQFIIYIPIEIIFTNMLITNGFPAETIANIRTLLFPLEVLASIYTGKICQENIDLKVVFNCSGFAILKSVVQFLTVLYFVSGGNSTLVMGLVAISLCANSIHTQVSMVAINSHSNKICNESVGTTFLSTRSALTNFGYMWVNSITLFLIDFLSWHTLCLMTLLLGLFYLYWLYKTIKPLSKISNEE